MEEEEKIVHVQSVLFKSEVEKLKKKTGEETVKEAIAKAVHFFLDSH